MGRRWRGPGFGALGLALGLVAVAAACSRDGFTYVENGDEGVFLKVPDDWEVVEVDQFDLEPTSNEEVATNFAWRVDFSGAGSGTPGASLPTGRVEVRVLSPDERDRASVATARGEILSGLDPAVAAGQELTDVDVNVRLDQDIAAEEYWGNRQVFELTFTGEEPRGPLTFDQVVLYDDQTSRLYRLLISCETDCYSANREVIDTIVDSLTVE